MEIEKLKDMLRNAAGGPVGIQMCHEAADALEQLQAENEKLKAYEDTGLTPEEVQQMRWIPVEERLPEEEGTYIVCVDGEVKYDEGYREDVETFKAKWLQGIGADKIKEMIDRELESARESLKKSLGGIRDEQVCPRAMVGRSRNGSR